MNVAIVGAGFVGLTTAAVMAALKPTLGVTVIETCPHKVEQLRNGKVPFHEPGMDSAWAHLIRENRVKVVQAFTAVASKAMREADATIACVGTPSDGKGRTDEMPLRTAYCAWLEAVEPSPDRWFVIRSTVTPETINLISRIYTGAPDSRIVHVPEFLAEGTAIRDAMTPIRAVCGWVDPSVTAARKQELVMLLWERVQLEAHNVTVRHTTAATAAMIKLASNVMLASRLSTIQEIAMISGLANADGLEVMQALGEDPRIGSAYLDPGAGWGGSCLPKDTRATHWLARLCRMHDADGGIALAAIRSNGLAMQWVARTVEKHADMTRDRTMRIAWLGAAFKPGTSDTRESPAQMAQINVVEALTGHGIDHQIVQHDPVVRPEPSVLEAATDADVIVLATAWPEYRDALHDLAARAKPAVLIVDARNLWRDADLRALPPGTTYVGFGRPAIKVP